MYTFINNLFKKIVAVKKDIGKSKSDKVAAIILEDSILHIKFSEKLSYHNFLYLMLCVRRRVHELPLYNPGSAVSHYSNYRLSTMSPRNGFISQIG